MKFIEWFNNNGYLILGGSMLVFCGIATIIIGLIYFIRGVSFNAT